MRIVTFFTSARMMNVLHMSS